MRWLIVLAATVGLPAAAQQIGEVEAGGEVLEWDLMVCTDREGGHDFQLFGLTDEGWQLYSIRGDVVDVRKDGHDWSVSSDSRIMVGSETSLYIHQRGEVSQADCSWENRALGMLFSVVEDTMSAGGRIVPMRQDPAILLAQLRAALLALDESEARAAAMSAEIEFLQEELDGERRR
ncbi:hypothetical protein ACXN5S_05720 [Pseudoroseicyclus sp. H15]